MQQRAARRGLEMRQQLRVRVAVPGLLWPWAVIEPARTLLELQLQVKRVLRKRCTATIYWGISGLRQ
jgi:hypothetical protein